MRAQPQRERRREFLIEQGRFEDLVREGYSEVIAGGRPASERVEEIAAAGAVAGVGVLPGAIRLLD